METVHSSGPNVHSRPVTSALLGGCCTCPAPEHTQKKPTSICTGGTESSQDTLLLHVLLTVDEFNATGFASHAGCFLKHLSLKRHGHSRLASLWRIN